MKINNQIRMAVLFCSAIIIIFNLFWAFDIIFENIELFSGQEKKANEILLIVCGSFILFVFSVYSRQKGIKNLANVILVLLFVNILSSLFNLLLHKIVIEHNHRLISMVYGLFGVIRIVLYILMMIFASNSINAMVRGIKTIKFYAIAYLVANILTFSGAKFLLNLGQSAYWVIISLIFIIPYIFAIIFALQLKEEES